jgi:hypothetical protein
VILFWKQVLFFEIFTIYSFSASSSVELRIDTIFFAAVSHTQIFSSYLTNEHTHAISLSRGCLSVMSTYNHSISNVDLLLHMTPARESRYTFFAHSMYFFFWFISSLVVVAIFSTYTHTQACSIKGKKKHITLLRCMLIIISHVSDRKSIYASISWENCRACELLHSEKILQEWNFLICRRFMFNGFRNIFTYLISNFRHIQHHQCHKIHNIIQSLCV